MADRGLNYYCKECRIMAISGEEGCPTTMTMQMHIGTIVMPICYPPNIPAEMLLISGEGKDRHKYTYRLVE